jgi:hypothetical protein
MYTVFKITGERHFETDNILKMLIQGSYSYFLQVI